MFRAFADPRCYFVSVTFCCNMFQQHVLSCVSTLMLTEKSAYWSCIEEMYISCIVPFMIWIGLFSCRFSLCCLVRCIPCPRLLMWRYKVSWNVRYYDCTLWRENVLLCTQTEWSKEAAGFNSWGYVRSRISFSSGIRFAVRSVALSASRVLSFSVDVNCSEWRLVFGKLPDSLCGRVNALFRRTEPALEDILWTGWLLSVIRRDWRIANFSPNRRTSSL